MVLDAHVNVNGVVWCNVKVKCLGFFMMSKHKLKESPYVWIIIIG